VQVDQVGYVDSILFRQRHRGGPSMLLDKSCQ